MEVSPSHVVLARAFCHGCFGGAGIVAHEAPGEKSGDGVSDCPPDGHESDEPRESGGEEFDEIGCVEDIVPSCACGVDRDPWI